MDAVLTENQTMLQTATRRFVENRSPVALARKLDNENAAFPIEIWRECTEQGWIGLVVPEEFGGMLEAAEGVIDAAIVAEELGRMVFAGPFHANAVVAFALTQSSSSILRERYLAGLCSGTLNASWCFAGTGPDGGIEARGITVTRSGSAVLLEGIAGFVENAAKADALLVTANDGAGLSQFIVPADLNGITIEPLHSLDLGRSFATVRFDRVLVPEDCELGTTEQAAQDFERQLQFALVLQSAETIGLIDRALEFTLEWVTQRYAFGRPIGSFQALKHRLADHAAQFECAKAAVAHAARSVEHGAVDAALAVSVAKSQCGQCGVEIIRDCVQMHGGIGLTWDHDLHFYLRRAVANQALLGTPSLHHERLARLAGL